MGAVQFTEAVINKLNGIIDNNNWILFPSSQVTKYQDVLL